MQVGDLVRVPQYSYVAGFVGIVTSVNHLGSALVTSLCASDPTGSIPTCRCRCSAKAQKKINKPLTI